MIQTEVLYDAPQVRFDKFIPYAAVELPGVPENVIGHAARLATIEFARLSQAVRRTIYIDVQAGVSAYHLRLEDSYSFLGISQVCLCDRTMRPARDLDCCTRWTNAYYFEQPSNLYISCPPNCDVDRGIEMRVSVVPGQDSCHVDKWVYDLYAEHITHGALARIYGMPSEEWFSPQTSAGHARAFKQGVSDAVIRDRSAWSQEPTMMSTPRGFLI